MHPSSILATLCGVSAVFAAPSWPHVSWDAANTAGHDTVSDYFNLLAQKVAAAANGLEDRTPVCDLTRAHLPTGPSPPLPNPDGAVRLAHVAIGRGTQNYTCESGKDSAPPTAVGAVATLFNASCIASAYPDLLHMLPRLALQFDLPPSTSSDEAMMGPTGMVVSGQHYFTNPTTPFFNLDEGLQRIGETSCDKLNSANAPADAPRGRQGEPAVPWLHLGAKADATGGLHDVYRVMTAGGSAPATCKGMPASFEVQYAAEYWFFSSS